MKGIPIEERQRIIDILKKKNVNLPCPRCSNKSFSLVEGYFNQSIQGDLKGMVIGGPSIPTTVTICNNCGFLSQHSLGVLGLLPQKEKPEKKE